MKFMRDRDLGPDGPNWIAPFAGTVRAYKTSVDVNGAAMEAVENGDIITLDSTATPAFAGDYEVLERTSMPPHQPNDGAEIELKLQTYYPTAPTDVSDPPGDSYQTLPNSLLAMQDSMVASPFWVMQSTPTGMLQSDGTVTMGVPDLSIWWGGDAAPTLYPNAVQLTKVPVGQHVNLYLNVPMPSLGLVTTTPRPTPTMSMDQTQYPQTPEPAGVTLLYSGIITPDTSGSVTAGTLTSGLATLTSTSGSSSGSGTGSSSSTSSPGYGTPVGELE